MKIFPALSAALAAAGATAAALAMGPDPGGHTGATVTPETTKTDRPAVDAARQSSSGSSTETNRPADARTAEKRK
jgi:hypothetical protein